MEKTDTEKKCIIGESRTGLAPKPMPMKLSYLTPGFFHLLLDRQGSKCNANKSSEPLSSRRRSFGANLNTQIPTAKVSFFYQKCSIKPQSLSHLHWVICTHLRLPNTRRLIQDRRYSYQAIMICHHVILHPRQ